MSALPLLWLLTQTQWPTDSDSLGCEDVQRIELSRTRLVPQKVCVSPGLMTGFVFETPVSVELQEELRFEQVSRGHANISVMPPKDMSPGERLRFSARYVDGRSPDESVTLILVASSGQATRQVEVFRDTRTRDSFEHELEQERASRRRLLQEMDRLRLDLERIRQQYVDPHQLRRLIASGSMTREGVRAKEFKPSLIGYRHRTLTVTAGTSYRSQKRFAIELWLSNSSPSPWRLFTASLQDPRIEQLPVVSFWQQERLEPDVPFLVVIEAEISASGLPVACSVLLTEEDGTTFSIKGIELP